MDHITLPDSAKMLRKCSDAIADLDDIRHMLERRGLKDAALEMRDAALKVSDAVERIRTATT